jgi:hypothetical protein
VFKVVFMSQTLNFTGLLRAQEIEQYRTEVILSHLLDFSFSSLRNYQQEYALIVESLPKAIEQYHKMLENSDISKCKLRLALDIPKMFGLEVHNLHREDDRRLVFEAAYVLCLYLMPQGQVCLWSNTDAMLESYPSFNRVDEHELSILLQYRNVMSVAMLVLAPKSKKAHLLDLVTRIVEGNDVRYITGSGETAATRRRVAIYENEGNIKPLPRPPRKNFPGFFKSSGSMVSMPSSSGDSTCSSSSSSNSSHEGNSSKHHIVLSPTNDHKRKRADSEVNFHEAANVLAMLMCSTSQQACAVEAAGSRSY